jgi:hypothetical protein
MKILLINNNPVVSRLTALSARKEDIEIDEVQEVTELTAYNYDIVFVDADSWNEDVKSTIFTHIETKKRVLFYAQDDNEDLDSFDKGILKPFLPSEVSAVIRSVEEITTLDNISNEIEEEKSIDLVEESKEDKVEENSDKLLDIDSLELESAEVKTDLMDELTKIDDQKIEKETLLTSTDFEDDLFKDSTDTLTINANDFASKNVESDLFDLDLNDDENLLDKDLFAADIKTDDKKSEDELLEFDLEKDNELSLDNVDLFDAKEEVSAITESEDESLKEEILEELPELTKVEDEVKEEKVKEEIETKVLDAEEIETIKDILEDDTSDVMELDDLIAPSMAAAGVAAMAVSTNELVGSDMVVDEDLDKKKKKKSKKEKKVMIEDTDTSDTLVDTLSTLKVESLRELLAGATVSIKIEFPKA